ncbi:hypothetical protein [Muricoccus radiodurans]|uniref:hypothetical protein n=1 Tax=Muricoccus radiodurans TaxID=2231721 RepID=UPI003CF752ED
MRKIALIAAMAALVAAPAFAQGYGYGYGKPDRGYSRTGRSPGAPVDRGPMSPDANRAYMGGGLVLEGPPGAPAPMPQPTDPRAARGGVIYTR